MNANNATYNARYSELWIKMPRDLRDRISEMIGRTCPKCGLSGAEALGGLIRKAQKESTK
jgi:hypothetical protein